MHSTPTLLVIEMKKFMLKFTLGIGTDRGETIMSLN